MLDKKFLLLLSRRNSVVARIGKLKQQAGLKVVDVKRWNIVLKSRIEWGRALGLSKELVQNLFHSIHKDSVKTQKAI